MIEKDDIITIEGYHEKLRFKVTSVDGEEVLAVDCDYLQPITCSTNQVTVLEKHGTTSTNTDPSVD